MREYFEMGRKKLGDMVGMGMGMCGMSVTRSVCDQTRVQLYD